MVWNMQLAEATWNKVVVVDAPFGHSLSVRRIRFNERFSDPDSNKYTVATCAADHSVRIFRITL